jgi:hypothetical protein
MAEVKQRREGTWQRKRIDVLVWGIVAAARSDRLLNSCIVQLLTNK